MFNKKIIQNLFSVLILIIILAFTQTTVKASSDITPPILNGISVDKYTVTNGEDITITANVSDDISGIKSIQAYYGAPSGTETKSVQLFKKAEGKYSVTISIGQSDAVGQWKVDSLKLSDNALNIGYVLNTEKYSNSLNGVLQDLSTGDFEVKMFINSIGVSLDKTEAILKVGEIIGLIATLNPLEATNKNVTWASSDNSVATVDSTGKVLAVSAGISTITITTLEGSKTATCNVTVNNPIIEVIPSTPTGITAVSAGYNSSFLKWTPSLATDAGDCLYEVYSASSSSGLYSLIASTTATSYNNTGLTTDNTYYYKVRAYIMVGTTKVYSDFSVVISVKPIPAMPTKLIVTRVNSTRIQLTWSGVAGANGYELYRATSSTGTYSLFATTSYLYYTNSGLTAGKAYYYKIKSYRTISKVRVYSNLTVAAYCIVTKIIYTNLVQPNVVYGKFAGLTVEIIDEYKSTYLIKESSRRQIWVATKKVTVSANPVTNTKYLDKVQLETYVNTTSTFVSNTNYFTWVDLNRQRVSVFAGSAGRWVLQKTYSCASGNNATPSKIGLYTSQDKGYSFIAGSGVIVEYWTRYSGNYLLHSILLNTNGSVFDGTLGKRASHGCIRMPLDMAKWYYEKITWGSLIWVN